MGSTKRLYRYESRCSWSSFGVLQCFSNKKLVSPVVQSSEWIHPCIPAIH